MNCTIGHFPKLTRDYTAFRRSQKTAHSSRSITALKWSTRFPAAPPLRRVTSRGPALCLVIAFALFFLIQIPLSRWWLHRHEHGPLEYLWRRLTYVQPAGVTPAAVAARVP